MYATRNGYPVVMRQQVQFLTERFYNNPRPFYGFEEQGAVWARMISAPANVLGRTNASMQFLSQGVAPLGALLAGILGGLIGLRLTMLIGVLGIILAGTWLLLSPVRKA